MKLVPIHSSTPKALHSQTVDSGRVRIDVEAGEGDVVASVVAGGLLALGATVLGGYLGSKVGPQAMQVATRKGGQLAERVGMSRGVGKAVAATLFTIGPAAAAPIVGGGLLAAVSAGALFLGAAAGGFCRGH